MGAGPNWYPAVSPGTAILAILLLSPYPSQAGLTAVEGVGGIASLDAASGRYEVRSQESNWVFAGHSFHILLDLAVGGWPGPPSATTHFPATLAVDWVRLYQ